MKSIKSKITLWFMCLFIIFSIVLNLSIRFFLKNDFEKNTTNSMNNLMINSRELIKNKLLLKDSYSNSDWIDVGSEVLWDIKKLYKTYGSLYSSDNKNSLTTTDNSEEDISLINEASQNKAVVKLYRVKNTYTASISYPIYINYKSDYTLYLTKDFSENYLDYIKILNIITLLQVFLGILILLITYLISSRITKPISSLIEGVKEVSLGNFDYSFESSSLDEIGILSREFSNMKKEIKNQLEYLMKEKENALLLQKSKSSFFNNVTHELKTPLTTISGYSQLLLSPKVEDKNFRDRAITGIFQESERMHSLIVELINISKNLNNPQKELIPIELSTFISRILDNLKIKWKNKAHSVNINIEDALILSNSESITSLLTNILDNALKYSLDNGVIAINLKTQDNLVYLTVENSYEGSTSFVKDKLFEPFVKGTNSTEDSNGLGLYICKEIVHSLNGEITIELTEEIFKLTTTFPSFCNISETI
ncbi:HAMP domain-containing sensor histidine kinase [Clostridium intestinale]|uniref:HAMP domain-containing sensor histidine kinase n=1 Tax=Clostridium intestinale TaxID=36845 RepID=UPI0028EE4854|nr:HAMP domain-containing sensor histidine kinase [Clostridium intestinale]